MSQLTVNTIQLGQSGTPANNFVLTVPSPEDGTIKLSRGNVGSTTQDVISVNAAGEVSFPATGSFGKILQVVQTVITAPTSTTSTSFVNLSGFTASITPSSASNKVLVIATINGGGSSNAFYRLARNGTDTIFLGDAAGSTVQSSATDAYVNTNSFMHCASIVYLDSPSSTSSVTYTITAKCFTGTLYLNGSYSGANQVYATRSPSSITLMEVVP